MEEAADDDPREQDGGTGPAEDTGTNVSPGRQDEPGSKPEDEDTQSAPDPSGAVDHPPPVTDPKREDVDPIPSTTHHPTMDSPEGLEDQEPQMEEEDEGEDEEEEEEEFLVLDAEHPLVKRQQAALNKQLKAHLARLELELKEKREIEKKDASHLEEMGVQMFGMQKQLARLQARLEARQRTKIQAEAKHRQAQEQLDAMKSQYCRTAGQESKARANVSQLEAELEQLMLHLVFTQGVSTALLSNIKTLKNATRKAGTDKTHAEDQKLKQDMYVERLTKHMEKLTNQVAMYEVQTTAQSEEKRTARKALSEAETEMESLVMARKQLLQQWNSSLLDMRKRDEAFNAMQEAIRNAEDQAVLLDRGIEGYKRSITEEQDQTDTLTMQLNWLMMEAAAIKNMISQKQLHHETLQAQHNTCLHSLQEAEETFSRLSKETEAQRVEMNEQRRQLEKESTARLQLEEKIVTNMQQKLTHNKAAKYSQQLTSKTILLKKEKLSLLWQLEAEVAAAGLESSLVNQHLDSLSFIQKELAEELASYSTLVTTTEAKIAAINTIIAKKQTIITNYNKEISKIAARTGHDDLSPLQIKMAHLRDQLKQLSEKMKSDQQFWMKQHGTLVGLTQELQTNSKLMQKLQAEYTVRCQTKVRLESQIEAENREEAELEKNMKMLKGDLVKLNTLLSKNGQLLQALEQENALTEADFLHRIKEAQRQCIEMEMKQEKTLEEKERFLNCLVEAEHQIMLWEKKIHLMKETRSVVDVSQAEIQSTKAEIHRMELCLNQLMKEQERLQKESEAVVVRREAIVQRRVALLHSFGKQMTKGDVNLVIKHMQRKVKDAHKHVTESELVIRELQERKEVLRKRVEQHKQQLMHLHGTGQDLDSDLMSLQDNKDKNFFVLVALQGRMKELQRVSQGSYRASSTSESVEAALQSQLERLHDTASVVHRVCEEFPQHQGALRKLLLALAAHTQVLEQERT